MMKNVKLVELNIKIATVYLNTLFSFFKDNLIKYKCLCCNKSYKKMFDENLKKRCFNTYKLSNHDISKFISLFRKSFYPYEYSDDWKNSMKLHYLKKKIFTVT